MNWIIKLYIVILVSIIFPFATSQAEAEQVKDTIFTVETFNGDYYYIGEIEYSTNKVTSLLGNNPESRKLLYSSYTNSKWGYVTAWSGVAIGAYLFLEIAHSYNNFGVSPLSHPDQKSKEIFILQTGLALGCEIAAIAFFSNSNRDFKEAINIYNQKLLSSNSGFDFRFNITSLSLTYNF